MQAFISQGTREATAKMSAETRSGNWYYGYDCIACDRRFAIFDDMTNGATGRKLLGEGHYSVTCPHCGANRMYSKARLVNFSPGVAQKLPSSGKIEERAVLRSLSAGESAKPPSHCTA